MNKQLSFFHPFSSYKQKLEGFSSIFSEWHPNSLWKFETNEWIFMIQNQHDSTIILASAQVNLTCVCPQLDQWKALINAKKKTEKKGFLANDIRIPLENSEPNEWNSMVLKQAHSAINSAPSQMNLNCVRTQLSCWQALINAKNGKNTDFERITFEFPWIIPNLLIGITWF